LVQPIHECCGLVVGPTPKVVKECPHQVASALNFLIVEYNMGGASGLSESTITSAVIGTVKDFTAVGLATASSVTVTAAWAPSTTLSARFSAVTSDDAGCVDREKYLIG
jgi:hypothetical protein